MAKRIDTRPKEIDGAPLMKWADIVKRFPDHRIVLGNPEYTPQLEPISGYVAMARNLNTKEIEYGQSVSVYQRGFEGCGIHYTNHTAVIKRHKAQRQTER